MTTMSLRPLLEWEQARPLIAAAVAREGCHSLTAYGDTLPQADLLDLACMLAIVGVHSGHLAMGLWEEATHAGELERCARGLLVRAVCARLRECEENRGSRVRYLENAFYEWRSQLPVNYRGVEEQIRAVVLTVPPPEDWMPQNANDSILVSLFNQHWPAEPAGCRYRLICDSAGGLTIEAEPHLEPSARSMSTASDAGRGVGVEAIMRSRGISTALDAIDRTLGSLKSLAKSVREPAHVLIDRSRKSVIVSTHGFISKLQP